MVLHATLAGVKGLSQPFGHFSKLACPDIFEEAYTCLNMETLKQVATNREKQHTYSYITAASACADQRAALPVGWRNAHLHLLSTSQLGY